MEQISSLDIPRASVDPLDRDLAEIDTAIAMVVAGVASRVRLVGLARPDAAAAVGLARAQRAGLLFEIDRGTGGAAGPAVTVGPRGSLQRVG